MKNNLSPKATNDLKLIGSALKGDDASFARLLDKYYDSIYYMLLTRVKSDIDAEDLTMETFGKAFNNLAQYTPEYAFSTWLFRIATNNYIDFLRKNKKQTYSIEQSIEGNDLDTASQISTTMLNPEELVIKEQKAEVLLSIIEKLKPRYRQLIHLRYYKEFSYEEIAQQLGLPLGTVKAQLYRARELLYPLLKTKADNI